MQADVGKAPDIVVLAAHHEDRLLADGVRKVIARLRDGICPADAKPFPGKDPRLLQRMEVAAGVHLRRHCRCGFDGLLRERLQGSEKPLRINACGFHTGFGPDVMVLSIRQASRVFLSPITSKTNRQILSRQLTPFRL